MSTQSGGSAAPAALLDAVLEAPALVLGGLPPAARDLDLLVPESQLAAVIEALEGAGFTGADGSWERAGSADAVDVVLPGESSIPAGETAWLFDGARPVPGYTRLVRPAPAALLLLLAVRYGDRRGLARASHAERVLAALADDPGAAAQAHAHAPTWQVERALPQLLAQVRRGRRHGPVGRYQLVREQQRRDGAVEALPRARALVRALTGR